MSNCDKLAVIRRALDEDRYQGGWEGAYAIASILLTAASVGPDVSRIAAELELEEAFVQVIELRMRFSGLWLDGFVSTVGWFDDESFPGFYEDLAVAQGLSVCFTIGENIYYIPARPLTFQAM